MASELLPNVVGGLITIPLIVLLVSTFSKEEIFLTTLFPSFDVWDNVKSHMIIKLKWKNDEISEIIISNIVSWIFYFKFCKIYYMKLWTNITLCVPHLSHSKIQ